VDSGSATDSRVKILRPIAAELAGPEGGRYSNYDTVAHPSDCLDNVFSFVRNNVCYMSDFLY
jgi:hypothetical protein